MIKSVKRTYISATPQDENTGNLPTYLSELEKEVNCKKYGLVVEEHQEKTQGTCSAYARTVRKKDLFIDNGGNVNFLIESDNLASLKLLEKTHRGKIDLIYIDPPYDTLSDGYVYSETQID